MQNCYYNKQRFLRKITACSPFASIQKKRGEKKRTQLGTTLLLITLILWSITIFHSKCKYFHGKLPLKNVQPLKTVKLTNFDISRTCKTNLTYFQKLKYLFIIPNNMGMLGSMFETLFSRSQGRSDIKTHIITLYRQIK